MEHFPRFVYFCGIYNLIITVCLSFPSIPRALLGLNFCGDMEGRLVGVLLFYTAVVQIYASRDVKKRASLIYYEALVRFVAGFVIIPAGLFGDSGFIFAILGVIDAFIGAIFVAGVTRGLGFTHEELLSLK